MIMNYNENVWSARVGNFEMKEEGGGKGIFCARVKLNLTRHGSYEEIAGSSSAK